MRYKFSRSRLLHSNGYQMYLYLFFIVIWLTERYSSTALVKVTNIYVTVYFVTQIERVKNSEFESTTPRLLTFGKLNRCRAEIESTSQLNLKNELTDFGRL